MPQLATLKLNFANKQEYNGRGSGNVRYTWGAFRRLCARFVGAYPTCHLAVRLKALLRNTPKDQVSSEWTRLKANWKATRHSAEAVSDCHSAICVRWVDG